MKLGENKILFKSSLSKFIKSLKNDYTLYLIISLLGHYQKEVIKNAERFTHKMTAKNYKLNTCNPY